MDVTYIFYGFMGMEGGRGVKPPLDFENFSKKGYFLSVEWEKSKKNFTIFPPLDKFGKIP